MAKAAPSVAQQDFVSENLHAGYLYLLWPWRTQVATLAYRIGNQISQRNPLLFLQQQVQLPIFSHKVGPIVSQAWGISEANYRSFTQVTKKLPAWIDSPLTCRDFKKWLQWTEQWQEKATPAFYERANNSPHPLPVLITIRKRLENLLHQGRAKAYLAKEASS